MNSMTKFVSTCIILFILLLQFYVFPSGLPQPAHIVAVLFISLSIANLKIGKETNILPIRLFGYYTIYTLSINLIYFVLHLDTSFLISSLYTIFNYLLLLSLYVSFNGDSKLKKKSINAILVSFLFLVIIYFAGYGRNDFGFRYNGFFNDPNQMAHWGLCLYAAIALFTSSLLTIIIGFFFLLIIILASASRSGLLGLGAIILGVILSFFSNKGINTIGASYKKLIARTAVLAGIVCVFLNFNKIDFEKIKVIDNIIDRVEETDSREQLEVRGYDLILDYPEYLAFGAGQGNMSRFNKEGEIHSNWAGILFYYGIIGFTLFVLMLYVMLRKLPFSYVLIALGPLLYGFSTYGIRTPVFYLYLAVLLYNYKTRIDKRIISNESLS